jgi:hypothetical protein
VEASKEECHPLVGAVDAVVLWVPPLWIQIQQEEMAVAVAVEKRLSKCEFQAFLPLCRLNIQRLTVKTIPLKSTQSEDIQQDFWRRTPPAFTYT